MWDLAALQLICGLLLGAGTYLLMRSFYRHATGGEAQRTVTYAVEGGLLTVPEGTKVVPNPRAITRDDTGLWVVQDHEDREPFRVCSEVFATALARALDEVDQLPVPPPKARPACRCTEPDWEEVVHRNSDGMVALITAVCVTCGGVSRPQKRRPTRSAGDVSPHHRGRVTPQGHVRFDAGRRIRKGDGHQPLRHTRRSVPPPAPPSQ